ncbi:DUF7345 domain-containing protein [Natronobacterium texcoconense]|uniref:PGF-CTERM protein n=1 Tax=Natronobacterium texcoconense TaxID=1095778 RepID=A0A1H1GK08_NATTX|nr:PGF-CTERM sorting domain-containing protein [Natronobacterium texcoconense]SDR13459.1 hypothetical protein SAMN04489842_2467 [Natronobacterium texcoconense]
MRLLGTFAAVAVASLLLISGVTTPVAASSDDVSADDPSLVVDLEEDGDATVSLVSVYDPNDDDERDAFESIRTDETTQEELLERFANRLDSVATQVAADDAVDREMSVTADSVDVRIDDDRGIVTLSVTWSGLAATGDGQLVVDEPFASGFETDRALILTVPAGATLESTTPEPTTENGAQATWSDGAALEGFEAVVQADDGSEPATESAADTVPGFGAVVAAVGIVAAVAALVRRDR